MKEAVQMMQGGKNLQKMGRKKSIGSAGAGRRAWETLRLALLWARKGGAFRNRLQVVSVSKAFHKGLKKLRHLNLHHNSDGRRGALVYGERELSFDDTPVIHVKMHRPSSLRFHIPCIKSHVDFEYDFDFADDHDDYDYEQRSIIYHQDRQLDHNSVDDVKRISFLRDEEDQEEEEDRVIKRDATGGCDEEGIDLKAEEFIAKFHQQMKLQRQISHLQYNEMLKRGSS